MFKLLIHKLRSFLVFKESYFLCNNISNRTKVMFVSLQLQVKFITFFIDQNKGKWTQVKS